MNDNQSQALYERLVNAGMGSAEAGEIVKSQQSVEDTEQETVDVDRLTKAMESIKDAFEAKEEVAEEQGESVNEAIQEATDIVDAVTKGADALLAEQRTQYEALSKALTLLTEEMVEMKKAVSSGSEIVQKSLTSTQAALNEPVMRKSISDIEAVPAPGEVVEEQVSSQDLISKAIDEIRVENTTDKRKAELRKAISMLECGIAPSQVSNTYSLGQ